MVCPKMKKKRATLSLLLILCFVLSLLSFPLVNATEDSWVTLEPSPMGNNPVGVAAVGRKIYAFSWSSNREYDPTTDTWSSKASMPTSRILFGTAVVNNKIYVIGGEGNTHIYNITEVYDPQTDTWETRSEFKTWREFPVVNAVNGKIYVMAGIRRGVVNAIGVNVTEIYDPETDTWTTGAPIPAFNGTLGEVSLDVLTSAVLDDKIFVIYKTTTYVYDTNTDSWSYGAPFPVNITNAGAGATTGEFAPKRIYVMGGSISPTGVLNNQTYVYNPETDTWTTCTPMPTLRYRAAIAVVEDRLYAIGGHDRHNYVTVNEMYTPAGYIPEFPSWIVLPLFVVATLAVIVYRKKLHVVT
jgi:N-acetylneuraminic acid mutarotase